MGRTIDEMLTVGGLDWVTTDLIKYHPGFAVVVIPILGCLLAMAEISDLKRYLRVRSTYVTRREPKTMAMERA